MTKVKPKWDTSIDGPPPGFTKDPETGKVIAAPATAEEIQAAINNRKHVTREDNWLTDVRDAAEHARINLESAIARKAAARVILTYRFMYALNLANCGEFDKALLACTGPKGVYPGLRELVENISRLEAAIDLDDNHECGCERQRVKTPHHAKPGVEAEIELPRRQQVGMVYSRKHGKVVHVWQASCCGFLNAHDLGPPEHQRHLHEHRSREEAKILNAQRRGVKVNAQMVDHDDSLSDHELLRPR